MLIFTIDFNLLEHVKVRCKSATRSNVFYAIPNLCTIFSWFLQTELVARKAKDSKIVIIFLKCIQLSVVPSETSISGYVDHQNNVSPKLRQTDVFGVEQIR